MKTIFLFTAIYLAFTSYLHAAQVTLEDDFSKPSAFSSIPITLVDGVTAKVENGAFRIYGTDPGYGQHGAFINAPTNLNGNSFRMSIDARHTTPSTSTAMSFGITSSNDNIIHLQHLEGGYRVAYGPASNWQVITIPDFGDERTTWHTLKITYDSIAKVASAYVDEKQLGPFTVDLGSSFYYCFWHSGSFNGDQLDASFANFILRY